ncbi:MAG: hypothetical protein CBD67_001225 [Opitutales bacterium TMED207]|nr:hypothetical protein [Puniceicoccaceae bacterium]RPG15728.1 MAG: hypothetical protein CBD67_001225 [Opitutales bacterium TMED207]|tara:strand:- start:14231 stop:14869 length:639 start_codon:yes stop_codon:yes gene_type:complete
MPELDQDSHNKGDNKKAFIINLDSDNLPEPSIAFRGLAFLLDYILVVLLATLIILQVILPLNPSFSLEALNDWLEAYIAWAETNSTTAAPILNDSAQSILLLITESFSIIFILYFVLCDTLFKGSSMGKKIFNLKTITLTPRDSIPIFHAGIRAISKTVLLFYFFPLLFLVAALTKRFHKSKQWGHDLISQTKVIDEYKLNQMLLKKVEGSL